MKIKNIMLMAAVATATLTGCGSRENKHKMDEKVQIFGGVIIAYADSF